MKMVASWYYTAELTQSRCAVKWKVDNTAPFLALLLRFIGDTSSELAIATVQGKNTSESADRSIGIILNFCKISFYRWMMLQ